MRSWSWPAERPRRYPRNGGGSAVSGTVRVTLPEHARQHRGHPVTVRGMTTLTRSQQDQALQALYDQIPALPDCDGRCWTTCGPISMSSREHRRIRDAGTRITPAHEAVKRLPGFWCEALTADKRCGVYELRPVVCRLWGAVESLPCVYGCQPDPGPLSDAEGVRLLNEAAVISGDPEAIGRAHLRAVLAAPELSAMVTRVITAGQAHDREQAGLVTPAAFRRRTR